MPSPKAGPCLVGHSQALQPRPARPPPSTAQRETRARALQTAPAAKAAATAPMPGDCRAGTSRALRPRLRDQTAAQEVRATFSMQAAKTRWIPWFTRETLAPFGRVNWRGPQTQRQAAAADVAAAVLRPRPTLTRVGRQCPGKFRDRSSRSRRSRTQSQSLTRHMSRFELREQPELADMDCA